VVEPPEDVEMSEVVLTPMLERSAFVFTPAGIDEAPIPLEPPEEAPVPLFNEEEATGVETVEGVMELALQSAPLRLASSVTLEPLLNAASEFRSETITFTLSFVPERRTVTLPAPASTFVIVPLMFSAQESAGSAVNASNRTHILFFM
jgi:hypothetical protein